MAFRVDVGINVSGEDELELAAARAGILGSALEKAQAEAAHAAKLFENAANELKSLADKEIELAQKAEQAAKAVEAAEANLANVKKKSAEERKAAESALAEEVKASTKEAADAVKAAEQEVLSAKQQQAAASTMEEKMAAMEAVAAAEQVLAKAQETLAARVDANKEAQEQIKQAERGAVNAAKKGLEDQLALQKKVSDESKRVADERVKAEKKVMDASKQNSIAQFRLQKATMDAGDKSSKSMGKFSQTIAKMGNQFGAVGGQVLKFASALGPYGLAAVAAFMLTVGAVIALGAAIAKVVLEMVKMSLQCADAANKAAVLREGLTGSSQAAGELGAMMNRVARSTPASTEEVGALAEKLYKAGKRGNELEKALREAANEASGIGKNPGPELLAKRMASADVVAKKWKDNVSQIFAGPSTQKATQEFYGALGRIVNMFSQSSSEGRALQKIVSVIVDPIISGVAKAEPYIKAFLQGMIIAFLKIVVSVLKLGKALGLVPPKESTEGMITLEGAMAAGEWVVNALAQALLVIAYVLAVVAVAMFVLMLPTIIVMAVIIALIAVLYYLRSVLIDWAVSAAPAAMQWIAGLAGGIKKGIGVVVDAVVSLAKSATSAFTSALKISSPSKVFEEFGSYTVEGYVAGVEDGETDVKSVMESVVTPPDVSGVSESSLEAVGDDGSNVGASGSGVNIQGNTFVLNGVADCDNAESRFSELLTRMFEGDSILVGAT